MRKRAAHERDGSGFRNSCPVEQRVPAAGSASPIFGEVAIDGQDHDDEIRPTALLTTTSAVTRILVRDGRRRGAQGGLAAVLLGTASTSVADAARGDGAVAPGAGARCASVRDVASWSSAWPRSTISHGGVDDGPLHRRDARAGPRAPPAHSRARLTFADLRSSSRWRCAMKTHAGDRGRDRAPALRRALAGRDDRDAARRAPRRRAARARPRRAARAVADAPAARRSVPHFIDETLARYPHAARDAPLRHARASAATAARVRTLREYVALGAATAAARGVPRAPRRSPASRRRSTGPTSASSRCPGGERALWVFVMVLAYSRAMWAEFVFDLDRPLALPLARARARAFGGVTRQWLFDNPKTVVLERHGDAVRFHPTLLELCAAMRVEPQLCAVRKPEHKGKVERAIRYLRDRFFAGRTIPGVAEGNAQLARFIDEIAHVATASDDRAAHPSARCSPRSARGCSRCPIRCRRPTRVEPDRRSTRRPSSASTPIATRCPTDARRAHAHARRRRPHRARPRRHRPCIAEHARSWGRRQVIEDARAPRRARRRAPRRRATSRAATGSAPSSPTFDRIVERWAISGSSLGLPRHAHHQAARPLRRRRVRRRRRRPRSPAASPTSARSRSPASSTARTAAARSPSSSCSPTHVDDATSSPTTWSPTMSDTTTSPSGFAASASASAATRSPPSSRTPQEPPRPDRDRRAARRPRGARARDAAISRAARGSPPSARSSPSTASTGPTRARSIAPSSSASLEPRLRRPRRERPAQGGSGVGKTMLAQNLAHAALAAGYTVRFSTLAAALADLLEAGVDARLRAPPPPLHAAPTSRSSTSLATCPATPAPPTCSTTSSAVATSSARRSSPPISPSSSGATVFPGAACVVALVDRFAQHCHRVDIDADSWRDKHRLDPGSAKAHLAQSRRKRP